MKLSPLISQFSKYLPKYTNLFSDTFDVIDVAIATSVVTITTSAAYTFGSAWVHMGNILEGIVIDSFIYDDDTGQVTCITLTDHGLTMAMNLRTIEKDPLTVTLVNNTDITLNGNFTLLDVPDRFTFIFQFIAALGSITIDGNVVNYANNRLEGLQEVTTLTSTTFSYDVGEDLSGIIPVFTKPIVANANIRISAAANPIRAEASYTHLTQNAVNDDTKFWLFLVYGSVVASKSRQIINDGVNVTNFGSDPRQLLIEEFGAIVFAPTKNSISARFQRDQIEDLKVAMFKTIMNFPVEVPYQTNEQYAFMFDSADEIVYNSAYLAYQFNYQVQFDIAFSDMFTDFEIVPFRDIDGIMPINTVDSEQLSFDIDLDEDS